MRGRSAAERAPEVAREHARRRPRGARSGGSSIARDGEPEEEIVAEAPACTSRSRSRRVAAMMRDVDARSTASPPTRRTSPRSIARRSLGCSDSVELADLVDEQRAAVGLLEDALRARATAPVNAPRSWPKSSDSSERRAGPPCSRRRRTGRCARGLASWSASARTSLPVPGLALDDDGDVGRREALAERVERRISGLAPSMRPKRTSAVSERFVGSPRSTKIVVSPARTRSPPRT